MEELKPCPFCGGEAVLKHGYVECADCWAATAECNSNDKAAELWNKRYERTCKNVSDFDEYFLCSSCDYECYVNLDENSERVEDAEPPKYCPNCGAKVVK